MRTFLYLLFMSGTLFSKAQVNLSSSLTACYALNGNANDPVSNLNGTLSSVTSTVDRFNNAGSAYAFNGTAASRIELPNSPLLKANQVSFSAWVRFNTLNVGQYIVFSHNGCSNYHEGYMLAVNNQLPGGFRLQMAKANNSCSAGGQTSLNGTTVLSPQVWYHIGFYAGPDSLKLYLNGSMESSVANASPLTYNPLTNVILGGSGQVFNIPLNGSMDNVRFYNRKLNNAEFFALYIQDPACLTVPSGTAPAVAFSVSSVSLCAGNSVSFTDLSTNNPTAWNWQTPGASTASSSVQNPVVTYNNPGTYVVSLVSSNTVGASNTGTQSIVVLPNPTVSISGPTAACAGQSLNLFAAGAFNYTWNTTQTGAVIPVNPGMSTVYSVIGQDQNGCSNTATFNLNVLASPVVFVNASPSLACQGQSVTLNASGALSYSWNTFQTGNSIVITALGNAVYQVTGTSSNACSGTASIAIIAIPLPQVLALANKTLVCRGNPVVLSSSGAQTYVWNSTLTGNTVQVNPNFSTTYTVVGTDANGCINQAVVYVQVSECVGISQLESMSTMNLFPNPTQGPFTIVLPNNEDYLIQITDVVGNEIFTGQSGKQKEIRLNLSQQAPGLYFVLLSSSGQMIRKPLMKLE